MAVNVRFFDDTSVPEFREYRGIKHDVFVLEQGWQLPVEAGAQIVAPDPSDPHSMFVIARAECHAIGIARATMIRDAFPHAELFAGQMERPELQAVRAAIATVNSVAVRPAFRGRAVQVHGRAQTMTAGKALMVELTRCLHDAGAEVVLLTTSPGIAAVFFDHLGYYVIDPPFHALDRTLINMGLGVHDTEHFKEIGSPIADLDYAEGASDAERRCIAYFRERSAAILQGRRMEEFCHKELAATRSPTGTYAPVK
jgi:GNAT superfamily N-acetyltransferase